MTATGSFRASDRLLGRLRLGLLARPYLIGSCALHGLVLATLWQLPGAREAERTAAAAAAATEAARAAQQIAQTQARELQYRVERMALIAHALGEAAGTPLPPDPPAPTSTAAWAARAETLSATIEAAQQRLRAARLARLTATPLAEATRQIEAEAAAERARPAAATPAQRIAQLETRAVDALKTQRAALAAHQDGVPIAAAAASARAADGIPRSAADQLRAMTRLSPPQGRVGVVGAEGGISVNPPGTTGAPGGRVARADDVAAGANLAEKVSALLSQRPPFAVTGSSFDLTGHTASSAGRSRADDPPYLRPPTLDRATLRTAAGRVLGAGGSFATRVYLDSWYVIGPFASHGERTMDTAYPPEELVDLDGAYRGKGGRMLAWHYASRGFYPFVPPEREERAVYYAYTELRVDEDRDVWLTIAADDDSMLWLDGRLVWKSEHEDKPWYRPPFYLHDEQVASLALAEGHRRVHLPRGVHRLLFKLFNDRDRSFFSVVLAP